MNRCRDKADSMKSTNNRRWMYRIKDTRGMTMGELLVVVAIIVILSGVTFIGVFNHQRSMAQLEDDNTAKELFMASQNHLTAAEVEGYPGLTAYQEVKGNEVKNAAENGRHDSSDPPDVYYIVVKNGNADGVPPDAEGVKGAGSGILSLMLPQFSIDETVRGGGSYIIRYQRTTGRILDVFYCSQNGSRFDYELTTDDYTTVKGMAGAEAENKSARRDWEARNNAVLGWYGGESAADAASSIDEPKLTIINAEKLIAEVSNVDKATEVKLEVRGVSSTTDAQQSKKTFILKGNEATTENITYDDETKTYSVVMDDITSSGQHFAQLFANQDNGFADFIPGENLRVRVVATYDGMKSYSATKVTNSLFWDVAKVGTDMTSTAFINNIRHLENLDATVSGRAPNGVLAIKKAVQTDNLAWKGSGRSFLTKLNDANGNSIVITKAEGGRDDALTKKGYYYPVDLDDIASYNGEYHRISNIAVDTSDNAGLFGKLDIVSVYNLELVDFEIKGSNAGALAGAFTGTASTEGGITVSTTISNVVAHNSGQDRNIVDPGESEPRTIQGTSAAGGLIGSVTAADSGTAGGKIEYCGAAITVNGGTEAGGLIGSFNNAGGIVTKCYAGGHTDIGEFYTHYTENDDTHKRGERKDPIYNVSGAAAGGLIGSFSGVQIEDSYATCSVSGSAKAGGFVGTASADTANSGTIRNCYCAGMVESQPVPTSGTVNETRGAFAGELNGATASGCNYYSIINEVMKVSEKEGEIGELDHYLGAVGDADPDDGSITAFDENEGDDKTTLSAAGKYNLFVKERDTWAPANAYDPATRKYYKLKFNLRTVDQLPANSTPDAKVKQTDKPASSAKIRFAATHYGDWPAPEVFIVNTI